MAAKFLTSHSLKRDGYLWYDLVGMHPMDKYPLAERAQSPRYRSQHIALQGPFPTLSLILYV